MIGDLVAGMMKNKGVAAFVTDGLARDRAGIVASGLPLFAAGVIPASPAANGPAVVGAPVVTQAFSADADAEMTAVYSVMALHEGYLVTPESPGALVHYVLQFTPAP